MPEVNATMVTHLASNVTTLCDVWRVSSRTGGKELMALGSSLNGPALTSGGTRIEAVNAGVTTAISEQIIDWGDGAIEFDAPPTPTTSEIHVGFTKENNSDRTLFVFKSDGTYQSRKHVTVNSHGSYTPGTHCRLEIRDRQVIFIYNYAEVIRYELDHDYVGPVATYRYFPAYAYVQFPHSALYLDNMVITPSTVVRLTSHTRRLSYNGEVYIPMVTRPTAFESKAGLSPDNMEIMGVLSDDRFTEEDFIAGKWNYARIVKEVINYEDPNLNFAGMGPAHKMVGHLGQVVLSAPYGFKAEMRSLSQLLSQDIGDLTSSLCRARDLGDRDCKVDLGPFTAYTSVTNVTDRRTLKVTSTKPNGYYRYGKITFTSGLADELSMEIKDSTLTDGGTKNLLTLTLPIPYAFAVADTVKLRAGCDRRRETCRDVFGNSVNFTGEPDMPGVETIMAFPE